MRPTITTRSRKTLQARFNLSPSGKLRFQFSKPLGSSGEGNESVATAANVLLSTKKRESVFMGRSPLLDCRSEIQQKKDENRSGWGKSSQSKALSRKQASNILETLSALDRAKKDGLFESIRMVTFTLPSVDVLAFKALADYSSYAVNRLNTWFGRRLGDHARCGVWEWQKRGALHYHCVLATESDDKYLDTFDESVKSQWINILADIGSMAGVDMFLNSKGFDNRDRIDNIQVKFEKIEKSVAAYLSKYLSKGDGVVNEKGFMKSAAYKAKCANKFFAPPRWSNRNRLATNLRKKYTYTAIVGEFSPSDLPGVLGLCHDCLESFKREGTEVLYREKFGYSMISMYALASEYFDCMDAIGSWVSELRRSWCHRTSFWHGFQRFGVLYSYPTA